MQKVATLKPNAPLFRVCSASMRHAKKAAIINVFLGINEKERSYIVPSCETTQTSNSVLRNKHDCIWFQEKLIVLQRFL